MKIEHELAERPLQPGQCPPQHDKARARHPASPAEIHQSEPLADRLVPQRGKIEMRLLAVMPQDQVRGLVSAVWYVLGRQVRQLGQDLVDLCPQLGSYGSGVRRGAVAHPRLDHIWLDRLTPLLRGPDLSSKAVAQGLSFLRASFGIAPRTVEHEELLGARWQATANQATVEFLRVVPDPSEIVHSDMAYNGPAAARPWAGNVSRRRRAWPCLCARPPLPPH